MTLSTDGHVHEWVPLQWSGRYRCSGCGTFGYKLGATLPPGKEYHDLYKQKSAGDILPYSCATCGGWAVTKEYYMLRNGCQSSQKYWRCALHRKKPDVELDISSAE